MKSPDLEQINLRKWALEYAQFNKVVDYDYDMEDLIEDAKVIEMHLLSSLPSTDEERKKYLKTRTELEVEKKQKEEFEKSFHQERAELSEKVGKSHTPTNVEVSKALTVAVAEVLVTPQPPVANTSPKLQDAVKTVLKGNMNVTSVETGNTPPEKLKVYLKKLVDSIRNEKNR